MLRRSLIILGYVGLTLLVVGVTFALVAYGKDYSYDFGAHRIIQKGHVIIGSLPNGVAVTADGRNLKKKTPYQAAYKVGVHTFSLAKDGFWPWRKTIAVVAGQVSLARYVILVPKQPAMTGLDVRPQIVAQSMSKDHRHLAYVTGGAGAALYTLDLGGPKPVKLYTPKAATATDPAEVLTDVTWSDDASRLLIVSQMGAQTVYRLASAGGGEPVNLTAQYHINLTGVKFAAGNGRQLYWISPEGLRRLDVDAQSASGVLAERVAQFWVIPDRVLYVQQTDLGRSLWSVDGRGRHQELIQALAESDSYSVAYASYRGDDELAVVPAKTQTGTLYTGIFGNTPVAKVVARGVTSASFTPDGHLLAFSSPTAIFTYDLEQSALNNALVLYSVTDQPGQLAALSWFDNYHLLTTRDGRLYWSEFDGANRVDLGTAAGGFPGYGSSDQKSVVMFQPAGLDVRVAELGIR
jgi:PEGA domain